MSDRTFDPNSWLDAYRETFAPVYKAQQEGFKTIERFARFQYSVVGDYLESGLAHAQAAFAAKNPAELLTKQAEIGTKLGEKISGRIQEFVALASDAHGTFTQYASDSVTKAAKKAA